MNIDHVLAVGVPSDECWSTVWERSSDDGYVMIVFSLRGPQAAVRGKTFFQKVEAAFDGGIGSDSFTKLFQGQLMDEVQIAALYLQVPTALVFTIGGANVWMSRNGRGSFLGFVNSKQQVLQGKVEIGDYCVLGTSSYFQSHPTPNEEIPSVAADNAVREFQSLPQSADIAVGFIAVKGEESSAEVEARPVRMKPDALVPPTQDTSGVVLPKVAPMIAPEILQQRNMPTARQSQVRSRLVKMRKLIIGILLFVVVIVGAVLVSRTIIRRQEAAVMALLTPFEQRLQAATSLSDDQLVQSLQSLTELKKDVEASKQEHKNDQVFLTKAGDLEKEIDSQYANRSKEKTIEKLSVYYDFRLIAQDFVASAIAHDIPGKLAVFVDSQHSRMLSLSLEKKQTQVLTVDEQLSQPFALSIEERKVYALGQDGIMQASLPLDTVGKVIIPKSDLWQNPKYIGTYGDNLYMLDTKERNIYRYDLTDPQASPSAWFRSKEGLDFDQISSLTIDGDVWIGAGDGSIHRFSRGTPEGFHLSRVLTPPSSLVVLYTEPDSERLYILEPHGKRLLIVDKNGVYQSAILSDDFATATGLIVDETQQKAFVLAGSLVYDVPL